VNTAFHPQKWPLQGQPGNVRLTFPNLRAGARWEVQGIRAASAARKNGSPLVQRGPKISPQGEVSPSAPLKKLETLNSQRNCPAQRNPILRLLTAGSPPTRLETSTGSLFQEPPRTTFVVPLPGPWGSSGGDVL